MVRLERDEAVASEQEAHATIDSLSESLEVSRAEVLSLKQDLVEHGLEGHANDRHMSRVRSHDPPSDTVHANPIRIPYKKHGHSKRDPVYMNPI